MLLWKTMKENLEKEIERILEEFGVKNPKVGFTVPTHIEMGDYSTNVAMAYAKELEKKPMEFAEEIILRLAQDDLLKQIKVKTVAPGFINFFFDKEYFGENVKKVVSKGGEYGKNENLKGQKFFIEHTQPNPFKEFHIGHLMNNTIGESVARSVRHNGAKIKTATYHGDIGLHVAKAIWAIKNSSDPKEAYARGHEAYEENGDAKKEITEINKKIYDKSDEKINLLYEKGRKTSLDHFESLYQKLDSQFDFHFYESEAGEIGKKIVLENIGKVFEESDGAVVFKGENFQPKTHTRVFLTKDKLPTYEAKEVGLAEIKRNLYKYDKSITITANEQDSFFDVVEVAIGEVFPELKGKLKHLSHGMLKLSTGKMSSRSGNIITAEGLIGQVKEKVLQKIKDREFSDSEREEIAEIVAIGAIKYSILRQAIGGDIIFDFDKSISFEGDSGPYLQYATVRANSLLQKAQMSRGTLDIIHLAVKPPSEWETTDLERLLERFPSVALRAGVEYAPHYIVTFLTQLAGEFNSFYASHKIIDPEDSTSPYRLVLTQAFAQVMTQGLYLLGIKVPSVM